MGWCSIRGWRTYRNYDDDIKWDGDGKSRGILGRDLLERPIAIRSQF